MAKSSFNSELFKFAYFPTWDESVKYLAETLSDREEWDFSGTVAKSYPILKNYLEHYFRRLSIK